MCSFVYQRHERMRKEVVLSIGDLGMHLACSGVTQLVGINMTLGCAAHFFVWYALPATSASAIGAEMSKDCADH